MVKVRLARTGAKKYPCYRIVVADARCPRDGRFIEQIGTYDPMQDPVGFTIKNDRLEYWLGVGAQTSHSLQCLILKQSKEEDISNR
jgi:small subunit ribosomal protein S16